MTKGIIAAISSSPPPLSSSLSFGLEAQKSVGLMNADGQIFSSESGFPTIVKRICAPFVPLIEILFFKFLDCFELWTSPSPSPSPSCANSKVPQDYGDLSHLARDTTFTVNEVEALYELFKKLGNSIIDDSLIHKEDLQLALFHTPFAENLLLDRLFNLFDENKNGVIEFEEFVRTLSVFHPYTPKEEKIDFAFRLYDLEQTGYIEREDVKRLVVAILMESEIKLPDELIEAIINKTFEDADVDGDGRICKGEWKALVAKHPSLLRNMTLPYLRDFTTLSPSCLLNAEVEHLGNTISSPIRRR